MALAMKLALVAGVLLGGVPTQFLGSTSSADDPAIPQRIKLPLKNLADVPAELTRSLGIAKHDRAILEKLESRRLSLDVREVPLVDVIAHVRTQADCNVLFDLPALEEEGVNGDTPISARITDSTLSHGLNRLLQPYNLTYVVAHGALIVTSQLEAGNRLTFQVYPVADLVWTGDVTDDDKAVAIEPLIELIEATVAPNSWSRVGGSGSIRPFTANLSLAVNQTQSVHDEITSVLAGLRKARGAGDVGTKLDAAVEITKPAGAVAAIGMKPRENELLRAVHEAIISLSFEEVPLGEVINVVSEQSNLPFNLDRMALEEEGISTDIRLSIEVSSLRVADALSLLLNRWNLTWRVKNDAILITSQLEAGNALRTLIYPVSDLVVLHDRDDRWSVFHNELQGLVQAIISPGSWTEFGGAGSVRYSPSSQSLTVSQTDASHAQIAELLAALRESSARLPAITRAAGMPTPRELAEIQLRAMRAAAERNK